MDKELGSQGKGPDFNPWHHMHQGDVLVSLSQINKQINFEKEKSILSHFDLYLLN